jgi:thiamine-monophosphate kinase
MEALKYHRILLKLGGESLAGPSGIGIDAAQAKDIARRLKEVRELGVDIAIVIGAGNLWRGKVGLEMGMDQATADYMGMLGTVMNALALALPSANDAWLSAFAQGLFALADAHACPLVGGDTTQGPLNICITVFGEVPAGQALLRSGARPGDDIYVSGTLGDARLALEALQGHVALPPEVLAAARLRLEQPTPRVALGQALRGVASSALDVSDGLLGDLGHILRASGAGALIDTALTVHLMAASGPLTSANQRIDAELLHQCTLAGGDDYELAFTAPVARRAAVAAAALASATPVTRIGRVEAEPGLRLVDAHGQPVARHYASFDHFAAR